LELD
jgi:hypothetical protein